MFSFRFKWLFQVFISLALCGALLFLSLKSGAPAGLTYLIVAFLLSALLFFNFVSFRNYLVHFYSTVASRVRGLLRGNLEERIPPSPIPEANELINAVNDLSEDLRAKSRMIDKLERMRIDFVANVSHELKTPLTSIKGYTETLKSGALNDPKVSTKFLDRIEENADRLIAIIGDLLLLSRLESFPGEVKWEKIDSKAFSQKLENTFMPTLQRKKQKLKVSFEDPQWEGDTIKLEQVFINLVDNACRYVQEGGTIKVTQSKDPLHWKGSVEDDGPGIPMEHQSRIFERFYRVDSDRSRATGGTGLGLAIVKHIMMLHDGTISLESAPGRGTKFLIQWPRRSL